MYMYIYTPTENTKIEEKQDIYEKIKKEIQGIPKQATLIVLVDVNGQIAKEDYITHQKLEQTTKAEVKDIINKIATEKRMEKIE